MEQYRTIDEAIADFKEKYEKPVVVEQFTNPKPAERKRGIIRIFVSQAILCLVIIIGFIIGKIVFPNEYERIYSLISENVKNFRAL